MVSTKPPSGMRDYLPDAVHRRRYLIEKAERVFQGYGFLPLETPSMENLTTLLGKYGAEGDQLLYRILHRGDKLARALAQEGVEQAGLSELGLRYDLTVPLARVVAQYGHQLPRFFKRYQIQPVWRADRPAKGRFREFYQCDVDVTGTESLIAEAEVLNAIADVLQELGFRNCTIAINHRALLRGMIEEAGLTADQEETALVAIDKLEKIGADGVKGELIERGISANAASRLLDFAAPTVESCNTERLRELRNLIPQAQRAFDDLESLFCFTAEASSGPLLRLKPGLARGLSYYTGPIFEVVSEDFSGSLGGGGRYDNLVGMFSGRQVPAVGFSLGLERILLLMEEHRLFPDFPTSAQVMICPLPGTPLPPVIGLASRLRRAGIRVELYPEQVKLGRQLSVADNLQIPYALIVGSDELDRQAYSLKHLASGTQQALDEAGLLDHLSARAGVTA